MTSHDLPSPSLGPEDQDKDKGEGLEKPEYQSMSDVPAPAPTSQELKPALQAATPSTGLPAKAPPASSPLAPPASTPPPAGQDRLHSGLEYQFRAAPRPTLALRGHIREPQGASHPLRGHKGSRRRPSLEAPQARASLAARTRPAPPPPSVRRGPPSPGPSPATVRPLQWRALWCPPGLLWRPGPPVQGPLGLSRCGSRPPHKATRAPRHPSQRGASRRPVSEDKLQAW